MNEEPDCGAYWILDILRALWPLFDYWTDPLEG